MGPYKDCIDIITELGGVTDLKAAQQAFKDKIDTKNLDKLKRIQNPEVLKKIANAIRLCKPDSVFIDTGSAQDRQFIRELSLKKGEESPLPMPGHTIHFDLKEEQGRIIDRTFYIYNQGEEVNSLALKNDRADALEDIRQKMLGIMNGKTMMVGFFLRGPVGAPASNPALEISSSTYVMHSAAILYRNVYADFDQEVRRPAQCPGLYGSQPSDNLQFQLYLCRQHPVDEKRQPPLFGGSIRL
jgi:phosphoenolpyruvate carboxykinase (GTP)